MDTKLNHVKYLLAFLTYYVDDFDLVFHICLLPITTSYDAENTSV